MANVATLNIGINALYGGALSGFKKVTSAANEMAASVSGIGGRFAGLATSFAGLAAASIGLGSAMGTTIFALRAASDAEQTQIAMTTMLGSAEKAKTLIAELVDFAVKTPFELTGLKSSARQLIAFGTESEQVIPTLRVLGDIAAGVSVDVSELVLVYGHAQASGRVMNRELNQLSLRGIPIIEELAKVLGVAKTDIRHLAEEGKIDFASLQQALVNMTGPAGRFGGLMAGQAATIGGLWSNLKDSLGITFTKIGESMIKIFDLKSVVKNFSEFITYVSGTWGSSIIAAVETVKGWFMSVWNTVIPVAVSLWNTLLPPIISVASAIYSIRGPLLTIAGVFATFYATPVLFGVIVSSIGAIAAIAGSLISPFVAIGVAIGILIDANGGWLASFQSIESFMASTFGVTFTGMFEAIKYAAILTGAAVAFTFKEWRTIGDLTITSLVYGFENYKNILVHFFTGTIPELIGYFGRNWQAMGTDMISILDTVLQNIQKNIINFFTSVWNYVKSGGTKGFEFAFTPLTEGFRSAIQETLKLSEREIPAFEKNLGDRVGELSQEVGGKFSDFYDRWKTPFAGASITLPKAEVKTPEPADLKIADPSKAATAAVVAEGPKALLDGSKEALNAIAAFRRGDGKDKPAEQTAKSTATTAKEVAGLRADIKKGGLGVTFNVASI